MDRKEISDRVKQATANQEPLRIVGGNSKRFLGRNLDHLPQVVTRFLSGVVHYEPAELVIQVQAGTPLREVHELLDSNHQMLAFEPPIFDGNATIGGVVSTGISGSRRPYAGSVRDFVLGVNLISGQGDELSFGGQVMKNVAGYDVSRLVTGAMGCLGVVTEVSLKVLPKPAAEETRAIETSAMDALNKMTDLRRRSSLVSATAYHQGRLNVRFSGAEKSVSRAAQKFGGEQVHSRLWQEIDSLKLFDDGHELWRISQTPCSLNFLEEAVLIDWAGGQRWLLDPGSNPRVNLQDGHATLIRGNSTNDKFQPLTGLSLNIHQALKKQFDPAGILNPHKMFAAF